MIYQPDESKAPVNPPSTESATPAVTPGGYARGFSAGIEAAAQVAEKNAAQWWAEYKDRMSEHCADPHYQGMSDGADEVAEDIRALTPADAPPEPVVRVKPLKWFEVCRGTNGHGKWTADGYTVRKIEGLFLLDFAGESKSKWRFSTSEIAKAAAQADYEARILAAIETVSEADARADERAKVIAEAMDACDDYYRVGQEWNEAEILDEQIGHCKACIDALHTPASRTAAEKGGAA